MVRWRDTGRFVLVFLEIDLGSWVLRFEGLLVQLQRLWKLVLLIRWIRWGSLVNGARCWPVPWRQANQRALTTKACGVCWCFNQILFETSETVNLTSIEPEWLFQRQRLAFK